MTPILHLFIPGVPKNSNARSQWARYAKASDNKRFRTATAQIAADAIANSPWTTPDFTHITVRQISPVSRRRDPTGLAERLKGIFDGLVDAKVIPDDDENHISITLAPSRKGPVAGIALTLFEVPRP